MPSVSIVVPIYNVSSFLDECLRSIRRQTLKDIEVICVDDGSTDNSLDIVKKYVKEDGRFKYITKANAGYGDTLNKGFEVAEGEYVGIVESDDYIEPDMFEKLLDCAKKYSCDVVKSDYFEFTTKTKKKQTLIKTVSDGKYNTVFDYHTCPNLFHYRMNTWTGIYKNSFIRENNIKHNTTPGAAYQDNGFWFQTLSLAKGIVYLDEAFYHYRQDNPNSSINSEGKVFCMCDEYAYIEDFLNGHDKLKNDLFRIFLIKKYFNYMYTYKRINKDYKIQFLKRFASEFKNPLETGLINRQNTDANIMNMIERIVRDPVGFYYDDTVWVVQHNMIDMALRLQPVYDNRIYRILHKLRLVP